MTQPTTKAVAKRQTQIVPAELSNLKGLVQQKKELDYIHLNLMEAGKDYGVIPGVDKPFLFKAGAEMLRIHFNNYPKFIMDDTGTDFEAGRFRYRVTCELYDANGMYIGSGFGSCSSLESKYHYRWVAYKDLPADFKKETAEYVQAKNFDAIAESWRIRCDGATGAVKFGYNSKTRSQYLKFRIDNELPHDIENTIIKMAKKRAFTDAELTVTGASRIFLTGVEDAGEKGHSELVFADDLPTEPGEVESTVLPEEVIEAEVQEIPAENGKTAAKKNSELQKFLDSVLLYQEKLGWSDKTMDSWVKNQSFSIGGNKTATKASEILPKQWRPCLEKLEEISHLK